MDKAALQPSPNLGRSGGSRQYLRKRSSRLSCAHSSVPFTVNVCTVSHAPVFTNYLKGNVTWTRAYGRVSTSASSDHLAFRFLISSLPSLRNAAWSVVMKSSCLLISSTRCPVMTQDTAQLSGDVTVGPFH